MLADWVSRALHQRILKRYRLSETECRLTLLRAPRTNGVAERMIGTLRRACLDHLIVVNEQHRRAILREFVTSPTWTDPIEPATRRHQFREPAAAPVQSALVQS